MDITLADTAIAGDILLWVMPIAFVAVVVAVIRNRMRLGNDVPGAASDSSCALDLHPCAHGGRGPGNAWGTMPGNAWDPIPGSQGSDFQDHS